MEIVMIIAWFTMFIVLGVGLYFYNDTKSIKQLNDELLNETEFSEEKETPRAISRLDIDIIDDPISELYINEMFSYGLSTEQALELYFSIIYNNLDEERYPNIVRIANS